MPTVSFSSVPLKPYSKVRSVRCFVTQLVQSITVTGSLQLTRSVLSRPYSRICPGNNLNYCCMSAEGCCSQNVVSLFWRVSFPTSKQIVVLHAGCFKCKQRLYRLWCWGSALSTLCSSLSKVGNSRWWNTSDIVDTLVWCAKSALCFTIFFMCV